MDFIYNSMIVRLPCSFYLFVWIFFWLVLSFKILIFGKLGINRKILKKKGKLGMYGKIKKGKLGINRKIKKGK